MTHDRVSNAIIGISQRFTHDDLREFKTPSDDYALKHRAGLTIKRDQGLIVESIKEA